MELSTIRQVTRQLLEAVRYLHDEMHMMHRDIKPDNIIFDLLTNRIKLVDFGYACRDQFRYSRVGTPYYMAYEIVREDKYTHSVDEWSTGIVLYIVYGPPLLMTCMTTIFSRRFMTGTGSYRFLNTRRRRQPTT